MNDISIPEGNKLIELYYEPENSLDGDWVIWHDSHRTRQHISTLSYHKDWNSLMRVVEKISKYHYPNYFDSCPQSHKSEPYEDCAYLRTFGMRDNDGSYMVRFNASPLIKGASLMEALWLSVVDWVRGFNEDQLTAPSRNNCPHKKCEQPDQCKKNEGCVHDVQ